MGRYTVPLHKFIRRPVYRQQFEPPVRYRPKIVEFPARVFNGKWETLTQSDIILKPNESKLLILGFGVIIRRGIVYVSLKENIKQMGFGLSDNIIQESTEDIIVIIKNYTSEEKTISKGTPLTIISGNI